MRFSETVSTLRRAALTGAFLVIGLLGVATPDARADLVVATGPIFEEVEDSGFWRWEYTLAIGETQMLRAGSVFTIYDFDGYQPFGGDPLLPSGQYSDEETGGTWAFEASLTGITPTGLAGGFDPEPSDSPDVMNLSWTYAGPDFNSNPTQTHIGVFSAYSIYGPPTSLNFNGNFAGEAYLKGGDIDDRVFNSEDNIFVPENPVPEPGSMLLLSTGLFGAAAMIRRRRKAQAETQV